MTPLCCLHENLYNAISSKQLRFWCLSSQRRMAEQADMDERTRRIERTKSTVMPCGVQLMVDWRFLAKRWKWCRLNGEWIGWHDSYCNNGVAINWSTVLTRVDSCCYRKNSHFGWFTVFYVSFGAKWHERWAIIEVAVVPGLPFPLLGSRLVDYDIIWTIT